VYRDAQDLALTLATKKAEAISDADPGAMVIAADTVVWLDGIHLGTPEDDGDAARMLELLAGREHCVASGVVVSTPERQWQAVVQAEVTMRPMNRIEIEAYVRSGEPLDKAGAYGIQGFGSQLVRRINGCYLTVVGFPLCAVTMALSASGLIAVD